MTGPVTACLHPQIPPVATGAAPDDGFRLPPRPTGDAPVGGTPQAPARLAPLCASPEPPPGCPPPPCLPDPCALQAAFDDTSTFLAANRLFMGQAVDAAAVELGGTYAVEDGVDITGAFFEYLERPGIGGTHPRPEDAAAAFAEEALDLSPEAAQRFADDLVTLARRRAGEVAEAAIRDGR